MTGSGLPDGPLVCLGDFEAAAASILPSEIWDFIAGGSGAERTMAANRAALDRLAIVPRVLTGASSCATDTVLASAKAALPVAIAPMAYQRLVHSEGELAAAAAAAAAGVPFTASMLSSYPIEAVARLGGVTWFQLYWLRDRALMAELVQRAEAAGCAALMVTVDVPRLGRRLRDIRNGFALPAEVVAANLGGITEAHDRQSGVCAVAAHTDAVFAQGLGWDDLTWLRDQTQLPLIIKGILDPQDAARAAEFGAAALVISNHGGRQLDGAVASVDMVPAVLEAISGRCQLLLDSGIRSGVDIVKVLALGAAGVLLGRPALWGLAVAGAAGVREVLSLLADELSSTLVLAGCHDLASARQLRMGRDHCGCGPRHDWKEPTA